MSRTSLTVQLARIFQTLPLWLLQFFERPFLALFSERKPVPALFVLALPRSGSTVTYQVICHGLAVQYFSNLWNLFYQLPLLGGILSARFASRHWSNFRSQHGFVSGLDGPAEGLRFWRWWLDCGLSDQDCQNFSVAKRQSRARYLARVLSVLTRRGRPFVTAYLGHALVPERVQEAFQGAVLIRLRRDPVANGLSLLKSMRAGQSRWFSVLPKECLDLEDASEHERVAAQVYWLNRRLDSSQCADEMLTVHYESLCENPSMELERIRCWCLDRGIEMNIKFDLPERLSHKVVDYRGDPDAVKIRRALVRLEETHGELEGML